MLKKLYLAISFQLFATQIFGQKDSVALLQPALLEDSMIVKYPPAPREKVFISATRSAENADDLPFSTFTITSDEILRNGYVTLADVLKAAPGIRVSQPGSAVEGEKFLMNGLAGNRYAKILINDVPVKPYIQLGMPIAEQLPIRQAERIEILYGPAAVIYGGDACAGVVNIILKQSERPVFTQADLSFGRFGYNNLDLMFGGKVGKDKRIFRFSLFGSSTVREETNIDLSAVEEMDNYLLFGQGEPVFLENPNYRPHPTLGNDPPNLPIVGQLTRDSRMFGLTMKWRGIDFMYLRTGRSEHTAVGLNPLAVAYANPSNRLSEKSEIYSASFRAGRGWFKSQNILSFTNYRLESFSTSATVFDAPLAVRLAIDPPDPADWKMRYDELVRKYANGDRFLFSNGFDLRHELRAAFRLGRRTSLETGWQAFIGGGYPMISRLKRPINVGLLDELPRDIVEPFDYFSDGDLAVNSFCQINFRGKKLNFNLGVSTDVSTIYGYEPAVNYRAGFLYKLTPNWSVFANAGKAFHRPSLFAQSQSYSFLGDSMNLGGYQSNDETEYFQNQEIGVRFSNRRSSNLDFVFFHQTAVNLLRNGYFLDTTRQVNLYDEIGYYGYANTPGRAQELWGLRIAAVNRTLDLLVEINHRSFKIFWRNEIFWQYARGRESFGYGYSDVSEILNLPRRMFQFRTAMRLGKSEFVASVNHQSSSESSAAFFTQFMPRQSAVQAIPKFMTWDFTFRFHMSQHFLFYLQITNAFNRKYGGLDATGGADDLLFNPQQLRQARFGANYNLN